MGCHRPAVQVVRASIRLYTLQGTARPAAPCLSNVLFLGWTLEARGNNPNSVLPGCVILSQLISCVRVAGRIGAKVGEIEVTVLFPSRDSSVQAGWLRSWKATLGCNLPQ